MAKTASRWIWILVVILVVLGAWFLLHQEEVNRELIGEDIRLQYVTLNGEASPNAAVTVPFAVESGEYTFMNVAVDLNGDGQFVSYEADGTPQEEWVVQNSSARALPDEPNTFSFTVTDTAAYDRADLAVVVSYTQERLLDWDGSLPEANAAVQETTVAGFGREEIGDRYQPAEDGEGSTGFPREFLSGRDVFAQETAPPNRPPEDYVSSSPTAVGAEGTGSGEGDDLPESFNEFHSGVPDMDQGRNECVPTSTANSLLWLADEYDFEDKMPDSGTDVITELKNDFSWSASNGVVVPRHFLPGKQAFTQRHDIPIETHQVGGRFDLQIVPKIAQELAKGQDVEIDMEYGRYDSDGNYRRVGGHMVTVVGAQTLGETTLLDIHDPLSGGPGLLDIYKIDGTRVVDYRYQGRSVTYIRFAFAESPIEEEEDEEPVTAPEEEETEETVSSPEVDSEPADEPETTEEGDDGGEAVADVLRLETGLYPVNQFVPVAADTCDAEHWHAEGEVYGLADAESATVVRATDPAPNSCGFGTVEEVPTATIILTAEQEAELEAAGAWTE